MKNKYWFTLTELIIGITISSVVLLAVLSFVANVMSDFGKSRNKTEFITTLYDFTNKVNEYRQVYDDIFIIDNAGEDFDAIVLYSTGSTWVLFGVIDGSTNLLDPLVNNDVYDQKLIAYKELTPTQVTDIIDVDTVNAYGYSFFGDKVFRDINIESFSMTSYNMGALVNLDLGILVYYKPDLEGTDMNEQIADNIFELVLTF